MKRFCVLIVICLGLFCLVGCGKNCNDIAEEYSKKMEEAVNTRVNEMKHSGTSQGIDLSYMQGTSAVSDCMDEATNELDNLLESGCDESEYEEALELLKTKMDDCLELLDDTYYEEYGK